MSTIFIKMYWDVVIVYEKSNDDINIFKGIFNQTGIKKFIERHKKIAEKENKEFHHSTITKNGSKSELKFLIKNGDIKTVTTYILDKHKLNQEI